MSLGPVFEAALAGQAACAEAGLPHCVIGGVALQRWGEPRFTADADLSVLVEPGGEDAAVQALLDRLSPRIDDTADFARRTRVLLVKSPAGVGIDIVLAGLPFEQRVVSRSSQWALDDSHRLVTCSAEDLIVMKAFATRDKDWADVTGILERQSQKLNLDQIRRELAPLIKAKEEPEIQVELERRIQMHVGRSP